MKNIPEVKLGIVAVSRDCFPMSLSESRRIKVCQEYKKAYGDIYECPTVVENENDMLKALDEVNTAGCNALVVYLGNFGPESSETLLAKKFGGPVMFVAAAEEPCGDALIDNRGDAYCGMLNASYNLALRNIKAYIPEYPVGTPDECAKMISEFVPVARAILGLKDLKIISFGPRPQDFLACNAPIRQLYNMGIEIEENSELDLFESFNAHAGDERISAVVADMEAELGKGNKMAGILPRLAQYELTLLDWAEAHKGARKYVAFADKCWPAFPACAVLRGVVLRNIDSKKIASDDLACRKLSLDIISDVVAAHLIYIIVGIADLLVRAAGSGEKVKSVATVGYCAVGVLSLRGSAFFVIVGAPIMDVHIEI